MMGGGKECSECVCVCARFDWCDVDVVGKFLDDNDDDADAA